MALGHIAGGAVDGWETGENLRAKKSLRQAQEDENRAKREARDREDTSRAITQRMPVPGVTDVSGNYNPESDIKSVVDERQAAGARRQRTGLAGAIAKFIRPADAAAAAGVTPMAALGAGGMPQAPQAGAQPPAPPAEGEVDEVRVEAPGPRKATEEDAALYRAMAARQAGDSKAATDAFKEYYDLKIGGVKKALVFADPDQLSLLMTEQTGQDVEVAVTNGGQYTVSVNGARAHTYGNKEEFLGDAFARLDRNPEAGLKLAQESRKEQLDVLRTQGYLQQVGVQARAAASNMRRLEAQEGRDAQTFAQSQEDRKRTLEDSDFIANPDNAVLYPEQWAGAATRLGVTLPQAVNTTIQQVGPDGTAVRIPANRVALAGEERLGAYQSNPWVAGKIIGTGVDSEGKKLFGVVDPKGGPPQTATSFAAAQRLARRLYPQGPPGEPKAK